MPALTPFSASLPTQIRRLLIGLSWLGLLLSGVDLLAAEWAYETTNHDLLRVFDIVKNGFLALCPIGMWLQFGPRLSAKWRSLADLALCLVLFPWWLYCGLLLLNEDQSPWQDERVLATTSAPQTRIVRQYQDTFVTSNTRYRVVRLTPLGWWWQRVEPVDTSEFPLY
ncbi:hypothetical protein [Hymenobacter metallicola]|uniref:Uncharacterized protein n=1 Tax=Hymenobacter metallicola TaxID=2563114 RepID=A0A4Z0Q1I9_9BACT|nr:hypothetical protein [Hymenobacter metallicola]TGE22961.1 hypothetical protein E5K02_21610 [Hymenobacter metallicola]